MPSDESERYSIGSTCRDDIRRYITYWLAEEDKYRSFHPDKHISLDDAYERILHELSTIDDRFYAYIDQLDLRRSTTVADKLAFVIPELMKMLDVIYRTPNYAAISDDQLATNDDSEEFAAPSTDFQLYWGKKCEKLRKRCATLIWNLWDYERLCSQRCGLIHIFIAENSVPKVLLVGYILNGIYCYGYPKGKCNVGETRVMTKFREFTEEINKDTFDFYTYTDEDDLENIKKSPYIGRRREDRSRDHYYAVVKSSVEYTDCRHQKYEISDVEWYPVLRLPCCRNCQICLKRKLLGDSEEGLPINYHMVTLRDIDNQNSAIIDLLRYIESHGDPTIFSSYFHAHRCCGHDLA